LYLFYYWIDDCCAIRKTFWNETFINLLYGGEWFSFSYFRISTANDSLFRFPYLSLFFRIWYWHNGYYKCLVCTSFSYRKKISTVSGFITLCRNLGQSFMITFFGIVFQLFGKSTFSIDGY